jgi:hypothetical protein
MLRPIVCVFQGRINTEWVYGGWDAGVAVGRPSLVEGAGVYGGDVRRCVSGGYCDHVLLLRNVILVVSKFCLGVKTRPKRTRECCFCRYILLVVC